LLAAVTLVESGFLGVYLDGRSFRETWLWARRRPFAIGVAVAVVLGGGWWLGRVEYYLWRMRAHGHAPSGYALAKVGPRALPRIYRELEALGNRPSGGYRADLVDAITDIRHDFLARQSGRTLLWEVQAGLVDVEPALVAAVSQAFLAEPEAEERTTIANWAGDLDFNSQVELFCRVFPHAPEAGRDDLIRMLDSPLRWASEIYRADARPDRADPDYPWADASQAEIEDRQRRMREKLRCVTPLLIDALVHGVETGPDTDQPLWVDAAVRGLGRLAPWPAELRERLAKLLPAIGSEYLFGRMLDVFWGELARTEPGGRRALIRKLYFALPNRTAREALRSWAAQASRDGRARADQLFCDSYEKTSAAEREAHVRMLDGLARRDPCVAELLKRHSASEP
jgi:hypothetical protein